MDNPENLATQTKKKKKKEEKKERKIKYVMHF
jgi:hypothetical protein